MLRHKYSKLQPFFSESATRLDTKSTQLKEKRKTLDDDIVKALGLFVDLKSSSYNWVEWAKKHTQQADKLLDNEFLTRMRHIEHSLYTTVLKWKLEIQKHLVPNDVKGVIVDYSTTGNYDHLRGGMYMTAEMYNDIGYKLHDKCVGKVRLSPYGMKGDLVAVTIHKDESCANDRDSDY
jgi:hypothetical protein